MRKHVNMYITTIQCVHNTTAVQAHDFFIFLFFLALFCCIFARRGLEIDAQFFSFYLVCEVDVNGSS